MTNTISEVVTKRGPGRPALPRDPVFNASESQSTPALSLPPDVPQAPRRVRKPFGSQVQKLARPNRPGFVRRWFNDVPGRLLRAKEAGWEHVKTETGEIETTPVGVSETGGALIAYLMETPEEFYKEDQAAEQERINEMERSFKRGADEKGQPGQDGRYVPSRGISIKTV